MKRIILFVISLIFIALSFFFSNYQSVFLGIALIINGFSVYSLKKDNKYGLITIGVGVSLIFLGIIVAYLY